MKKLLFPVLLCLLFSSCQKPTDMVPDSEYRFEVTCGNCTIDIQNGDNIQSYNVQGSQTIPFNSYLPTVTVVLSTYYDSDQTQVRFLGSGYNKTLFNGFLYFNDPPKVIEFNL
ncbi:MAG TPA: hypothetical protein VGC08_13540 [Pedobacter sp.]